MKKVLLINPNSSEATLSMMVGIAQSYAGTDFEIVGRTGQGVPSVLVKEEDQQLAIPEVVRIGLEMAASGEIAGVIVAAYSDPGMEELQSKLSIPVTGIGKASMIEAAEGGLLSPAHQVRRQFSIATTTPLLVDNITRKVFRHGYEDCFAGVRIPEGDLRKITSDKALLEAALEKECMAAFSQDSADAVIIGGGPLGEVAAALSARLNKPVVAPIPASVAHMKLLLSGKPSK